MAISTLVAAGNVKQCLRQTDTMSRYSRDDSRCVILPWATSSRVYDSIDKRCPCHAHSAGL